MGLATTQVSQAIMSHLETLKAMLVTVPAHVLQTKSTAIVGIR